MEWLIAGRAMVAGIGGLLAALAGLGRPSRWSLAVGLLALSPLYIIYLLAVERIGAALASILLYTAPLWVIAASKPLLGENPGTRGLAGLALGLTGVVLITGAMGGRDSLGLALGLASGISYGLYILLARLAQLRGATSLEVGLHAIPPAAIAVTLYTRPRPPPSPVEIAWSLYLGIAATLVPYMLHTRALSQLEAYRVSLISLLEPLSATTLAVLVLHETLTATQVLGGVLILAAAYLAVTSQKENTNNLIIKREKFSESRDFSI